MRKYCGRCGAELDRVTGRCPVCPGGEPAGRSGRKSSRRQRKEARKAEKRAKWDRLPLGWKLCRATANVAVIALCMTLLLTAVSGIGGIGGGSNPERVTDVLETTGLVEETPARSDFLLLGADALSGKVEGDSDAMAVVQETVSALGLGSAASELTTMSTNRVDGAIYYRFQQNYQGIPVYGRTFVLSADEQGAPKSLSSNGMELDGLDTAATLTSAEVESIVRTYLDRQDAAIWGDYTKTIYTLSSSADPALAYQVYASAGENLYSLFVDIHARTVIDCFPANLTETVSITGRDNSGNVVSFYADKKENGLYSLEDTMRNIRIYDAEKGEVETKDHLVMDAQGTRYVVQDNEFVAPDGTPVTVDDTGRMQGTWIIADKNGQVYAETGYYNIDLFAKKFILKKQLEPVTSTKAAFDNQAAVTLMGRAQFVYEFFRTELGRVGFDGKNGNTQLVVNTKNGSMSMGNDISRATVMCFFHKADLSTELVGHEYMHSVERSISGMVCDGESGAIMEGYSDLFGEILEDYEDGVLDGSCDWYHAACKEQAPLDSLIYDQDRNLADPNASQNPAYVGDTPLSFAVQLLVGKDEVHYCSTIVSHAGYLMTTDLGGETPLTMTELTKLWYTTLMTLPANCTFTDLKSSMILTARNMGFPEEKICRVESAFETVGVGNTPYSGEYNTELSLSVFDAAGQQYGGYSVSVEGQKKKKKEPYQAQYDGKAEPLTILLDPGEYTITVTDDADHTRTFSKQITVREKAPAEKLRFTTDFGTTAAPEPQLPEIQGPQPPEACPDTVEFNGHYYYAYSVDTVTTWEQAKQYCESMGGYLATITSPEEDAFLYAYLRENFSYESAYFGYTDREQEGIWVWDNGEVSSYTNWHEGEPNSENPNEDYAMYYFKYKDGSWNDGDFGGRTVSGGRVFLCEWGDFSTGSTQDTVQESGSAFEKYKAAVARTTAPGSWTERDTIQADIRVAYGSTDTQVSMTLETTSQVSGYVEGDLSEIRISGSSQMELMGQTYAWTTEYSDGVAHYEYTAPIQQSLDLAIDPNFFDFDLITDQAILEQRVEGNQLHFLISGGMVGQVGIAAVQQLSGVEDLQYNDVTVDVTLKDDGTVQTVCLNFDTSMVYQGYTARVTYRLQYEFL